MKRAPKGGVILVALMVCTQWAPAQEDPDMPAGAQGKMDPSTYLLMRAQHTARLRGLEAGHLPKAAARGLAIRQMEEQERNLRAAASARGGGVVPLSSPVWTAIGPAPIPNGQTAGGNPVSGRVTAIAVHPTNPNTVYVGTAQGGVYRSLDGGTTWTQMMDSALTQSVGAVAIAPSNPSTVYIGTGESNYSLDSFFGVGVYRIDNADTSPTLVGPLNLNGSGTDIFTGSSISKIVVSPSDPNTIFVSSTDGYSGIGGFYPNYNQLYGLYRSTNAAGAAASVTFSRITVATEQYNILPVTDMAMDPANSNVLVAGVYDTLASFTGTTLGGIYRSSNALASNPASVTFTRTLNSQPELIKFAINLQNTTTTVLAGLNEAAFSSGNGNLLQSVDGGQTWSAPIAAATGWCYHQCWYDITLAMSPTDPNTILLGGSADGYGPNSAILKKSTNGGTTFGNSETGLHADMHAIAYAPSNASVVYVGNDGGIFKSTDGGNTWSSLNNSGFSATQFEGLALHPTDRQFMIGGTQDNGTEFRMPNASWTRAEGGDGGYSAIDQNAADTTNVTMYHTFFNSTNFQIGFSRVTSTTNAHDGGWTFYGCGGTSNGINCSDNVLFYAPMVEGPGNPNTLYFGTDRLYRSVDAGVTMTQVSQGPLVSNQEVSTIGISPQDDRVRIAGLNNARIFATTSGSSTLTEVTPTNASYPPTNLGYNVAYAARTVIDPNNSGTAYIALAAYLGSTGHQIWKTTNLAGGGASWAASSSGVPDVPVDSLVVDPQNSNNVYAGTDIGVYASTDGGATWNPFGTGLPRVAVFDMAINNPNRILRIATHGRGIWEIGLGQTPTTASVASNANPSVFGQSVTFTATVTPGGAGTPTGTVTFMDGAATLGTGTLNGGGTATFGTSSLALGAHSITAVYGGDASFQGSTSTALAQTVNQASSTTGLNTSQTPTVFGQQVTFTATISATAPATGTPTGTVTFKDNGASIGTGALAAGVATLNTSSLAVASHPITAAYGGDANFAGSASSVVTQVVSQAGSATVVGTSQTPSVFGQAVTFTATVSALAPGTGTPTGTVTFKDNGATIGTAPLSGGGGTLMTSALGVGTHPITAVYSGDADFAGSTSAPLTQTVNPAATLTALMSSVTPSVFGQSVTFTATLSAVAPGAGTPNGSVTFQDNGNTLGSGTLAAGVATFMTSGLSVGSHPITAVYGGDADFTGSTSAALGQTVNPANTATVLGNAPNPTVFGQPVTLTATVTATAPGAGAPDGTVTFSADGASMGTAPLAAGAATLNSSALAVGSHTLSAAYGGSASFNGSSSGLATQTVNRANSTTVLASSVNPSLNGQPVTFTATVAAVAPGAGTATGNVTFSDGATPLGTAPLAGGAAALTVSSLTPGSHSISASYAGDASFTGGNSNTVTQTVSNVSATADLSVSLSHLPTHPAAIGGTLTETAVVANAGPSSSIATLTVNLNGTFVVNSVNGTGCNVAAVVTCNLGNIQSGQTAMVTLVLTPLLGHSITFQANVAGSVTDPNTTNNASTDTVNVRPKPLAR